MLTLSEIHAHKDTAQPFNGTLTVSGGIYPHPEGKVVNFTNAIALPTHIFPCGDLKSLKTFNYTAVVQDSKMFGVIIQYETANATLWYPLYGNETTRLQLDVKAYLKSINAEDTLSCAFERINPQYTEYLVRETTSKLIKSFAGFMQYAQSSLVAYARYLKSAKLDCSCSPDKCPFRFHTSARAASQGKCSHKTKVQIATVEVVEEMKAAVKEVKKTLNPHAPVFRPFCSDDSCNTKCGLKHMCRDDKCTDSKTCGLSHSKCATQGCSGCSLKHVKVTFCKDGKNCQNKDASHRKSEVHPRRCRNGASCTRSDCRFVHPGSETRQEDNFYKLAKPALHEQLAGTNPRQAGAKR
jgi:hypothetical protein